MSTSLIYCNKNKYFGMELIATSSQRYPTPKVITSTPKKVKQPSVNF